MSTLRSALVALLTTSLATACGPLSGSSSGTTRQDAARGRGAAAAVAGGDRAGVRALLDRQRAALAANDPAAWAATLAERALVFGPRAEHVAASAADAAELMGADRERLAAAGGRMTWRSARGDVVVAPGGAAAWTDEALEQTVAIGAASRSIEFRVSQILDHRADGWRVVAAHISAPAAPEAARPLEPAPLPDGRIAPGAEPLLHALAARPLGPDAFAARDDVSLIGVEPGERLTGAQLAAGFDAWADTWGRRLVVDGPAVAELLPGGRHGWVAAHVRLPEAQLYLRARTTYRLLAVLVREGDAWKIAHLHLSYGFGARR